MHDITTPFGEPGYLVLAGSRLYGIDLADSDYDYVAAVVEPERYRIGLDNYHQEGKHSQHGFEQHVFSGDNYEGSCYSLWKLVSMFAEGNPTVLCLLFAHPLVDGYKISFPEFREMVLSAASGKRFLKYMEAQRKSMIGQRAQHVKRLELIEAHGFDTKFAGHVIRLGYQGIEFLTTGNITLPMPKAERQTVLDIRNGKWNMDDVIDLSVELQEDMEATLATTWLRPEADYAALSHWVVEQYQTDWLTREVLKFKNELVSIAAAKRQVTGLDRRL